MHYYGTRLSENISRREPEGYDKGGLSARNRTRTADGVPSRPLGCRPFSAENEHTGSFSGRDEPARDIARPLRPHTYNCRKRKNERAEWSNTKTQKHKTTKNGRMWDGELLSENRYGTYSF